MNHTAMPSLLKANLLRLQGDYKAALSIYQTLANSYTDSRLYIAVADCYTFLGNEDAEKAENYFLEAIYWLERALAIEPLNGRVHALVAEVYALGLLDYEKAAQMYRTAIINSPTDTWVLSAAASLYGVPENVVSLSEAIDWLEGCVLLEPFKPEYRIRLSSLYKEARRKEEAFSQLTSALLSPHPLDGNQMKQAEGVMQNNMD